MEKTLFIVSVFGVAFFISAISIFSSSFWSDGVVWVWLIISLLLVFSAFFVSKKNRWLVACWAIIVLLLNIFLKNV